MPNPSDKRGAAQASAAKGRSKESKSFVSSNSTEQKRPPAGKGNSSKANQPAGSVAFSGGKKNSRSSRTQLDKFFLEQVKDFFWAEKHLTKALPKMKNAATSRDLKTAIQDHTVQTQEHVSRLEQVFELLGKKAQAKKCDAMEALVKEGETAVEATEPGSMTRDVAIIMSSQKVEHYEIAGYGTLVQLAGTMGHTEIISILTKTLEEEKQSDQKLTAIAGNNIIRDASAEEETVPDFRQEGG